MNSDVDEDSENNTGAIHFENCANNTNLGTFDIKAKYADSTAKALEACKKQYNDDNDIISSENYDNYICSECSAENVDTPDEDTMDHCVESKNIIPSSPRDWNNEDCELFSKMKTENASAIDENDHIKTNRNPSETGDSNHSAESMNDNEESIKNSYLPYPEEEGLKLIDSFFTANATDKINSLYSNQYINIYNYYATMQKQFSNIINDDNRAIATAITATPNTTAKSNNKRGRKEIDNDYYDIDEVLPKKKRNRIHKYVETDFSIGEGEIKELKETITVRKEDEEKLNKLETHTVRCNSCDTKTNLLNVFKMKSKSNFICKSCANKQQIPLLDLKDFYEHLEAIPGLEDLNFLNEKLYKCDRLNHFKPLFCFLKYFKKKKCYGITVNCCYCRNYKCQQYALEA